MIGAALDAQGRGRRATATALVVALFGGLGLYLVVKGAVALVR